MVKDKARLCLSFQGDTLPQGLIFYDGNGGRLLLLLLIVGGASTFALLRLAGTGIIPVGCQLVVLQGQQLEKEKAASVQHSYDKTAK